MDIEFNAMFTTRLQALTADLQFYHLPGESTKAPQVVQCMLPQPTGQFVEGKDLPLICWTHHRGKLTHLEPSNFEVIVDCGLRVNTNAGDALSQIVTGCDGIDALIKAMHGLAAARVFGRYKLQLPFDYTIGDISAESRGRQPHPYYWVRFNLSFVARL